MTTLAAPPTPLAVDETRWPGLNDVPSGPRARIAARVVRRIFWVATRRLGVKVLTRSQSDQLDRHDAPTIVLHRPEEFFLRVGRDGLIGFGESYLTGAWDSPDLARLLTTMARDIAGLVPNSLQRFRKLHVARAPRTRRDDLAQAQQDIAHHYDLSNELFKLFLDPSLTYSSALFVAPIEPRGDHSIALPPLPTDPALLQLAQIRKNERLLDQANVGPGSRVLEIGTGWGELAIRAASRGATVRTVTLSAEQATLARERIAAAGYADRVSVELLDYRLVEGEYDAVVSVEMIEAVGDREWPTYFRKLDSLLAPGGRVAIQAITMPHARMLATRGTWTWINKYIFPGGFLPSVEVIDEITREHTSLRIIDRLAFGTHYGETLRLWDDAFTAAEPEVLSLAFDETFLRMWHFYLLYSKAGFDAGYIDVQQIVLERTAR